MACNRPSGARQMTTCLELLIIADALEIKGRSFRCAPSLPLIPVISGLWRAKYRPHPRRAQPISAQAWSPI